MQPNNFPFDAHKTSELNLFNNNPENILTTSAMQKISVKLIRFQTKISVPSCIFLTTAIISIPARYIPVVTRKNFVFASMISRYPSLINNGKSTNRQQQYIVVHIFSLFNPLLFSSFIFTYNSLFLHFMGIIANPPWNSMHFFVKCSKIISEICV